MATVILETVALEDEDFQLFLNSKGIEAKPLQPVNQFPEVIYTGEKSDLIEMLEEFWVYDIEIFVSMIKE